MGQTMSLSGRFLLFCSSYALVTWIAFCTRGNRGWIPPMGTQPAIKTWKASKHALTLNAWQMQENKSYFYMDITCTSKIKFAPRRIFSSLVDLFQVNQIRRLSTYIYYFLFINPPLAMTLVLICNLILYMSMNPPHLSSSLLNWWPQIMLHLSGLTHFKAFFFWYKSLVPTQTFSVSLQNHVYSVTMTCLAQSSWIKPNWNHECWHLCNMLVNNRQET